MVKPNPQENNNELAGQRLSRLRSGAVLVSCESLKDPNFDATVVLVCVHNTDGAYGLVLNRPSHMPLCEIFDGYNGVGKTKRIYVGGPVRQEELQILQVTQTPAADAHKVSDGVFLGGHWEDVGRLLDSEDRSTRLFLGYSGWGPDQLEFEIRAGAWEVYTLDIIGLLLGPDEPLIATVDTIETYLRTLTDKP